MHHSPIEVTYQTLSVDLNDLIVDLYAPVSGGRTAFRYSFYEYAELLQARVCTNSHSWTQPCYCSDENWSYIMRLDFIDVNKVICFKT